MRGGEIKFNSLYRIKHIGSGNYLSVGLDKSELTLKSKADQLDTIFTFRRERFPNDVQIEDVQMEQRDLFLIESY